MTESFAERRRVPRVPVRGVESERNVSMGVRVVNISLGGVLVLVSRRLEQGQYAHLSTRFGKHPLEVDIEVRHVTPPPRDGGGDYQIGARFVALDDAARGALRQFLADGRA